MSIYCPLSVAVPVSACASVHQKVAQDPPRLLAQGAKANITGFVHSAASRGDAAAAAVPGFQHSGSKPGSIPRRPDLLVRIEAFLWPA